MLKQPQLKELKIENKNEARVVSAEEMIDRDHIK